MKITTFTTFIIGLCFANPVFCQDTSQNQKLSQEHTYDVSPRSNNFSQPAKPHIYRDTRLGSSSPRYDTYKKNDYGAGAITTNPNKGTSGMATYPGFPADSLKKPSKVYRDTRLGSSSPLYDTYKKNDRGAGAVTTNPNKGSSSGSVPNVTDSTNKGK